MIFSYWLLIAIVIIPLGFVLLNRMRLDFAALLMACLLGICQFIGLGMLGPSNAPQEAVKVISGFSQPVVITLLSLFILTRALERSGVTRWVARSLVKMAGANERRLIASLTATSAFFSLFMNNVAAGTLLLPSAMDVARRTGIRPSRLLIPVAYGSLLGGSATYFTTANIIMSDLLLIANPPQAPLKMLDFTPTGGLIALAGILVLTFFGSRLLPRREPEADSALAQLTGSELEDIYELNKRLWEARVTKETIAAGKTLEQTCIGQRWGVTVVAIRRGPEDFILPAPNHTIQNQDVLLLVGREDKICQLTELGLQVKSAQVNGHLSPRGIGFAEVILSPHSRATGQTLKEIGFRQRYGLTVVALKRRDQNYRSDVGDIDLSLGDSLLVVGSAAQIKILKKSLDYIIIEPNPSDQPVYVPQALLATGLTFGAIAASIAGVPIYLSVLTAALLSVLFGVINMEDAFQAIEWQTLFIIAGMYVVSLGMVQSGFAEYLGKGFIHVITPLGGIGIAAGAFLLSSLLTQIMGGQVTALVTGPVMLSAAILMGVNPQAVAVANAIGCSASFLTPFAHPVNIMMMAPGSYRFADFLKAGWLMYLVSFIMLLVGLSLFWRL